MEFLTSYSNVTNSGCSSTVIQLMEWNTFPIVLLRNWNCLRLHVNLLHIPYHQSCWN